MTKDEEPVRCPKRECQAIGAWKKTSAKSYRCKMCDTRVILP